jgi:hypothetical protein
MTTLDTRQICSAATLTASYVASDAIEVKNVDHVVLTGQYTTGSDGTASSIQLKIEFANPLNGDPVSTDWVQETTSTLAPSVITDTPADHTQVGAVAATAYPIYIAVPINTKFFRVSRKETKAAAAFGTLSLNATLRSTQSFN